MPPVHTYSFGRPAPW